MIMGMLAHSGPHLTGEQGTVPGDSAGLQSEIPSDGAISIGWHQALRHRPPAEPAIERRTLHCICGGISGILRENDWEAQMSGQSLLNRWFVRRECSAGRHPFYLQGSLPQVSDLATETWPQMFLVCPA